MTAMRLTVKSMREQTGLSAPTIRLYADAGLIPVDLDTNGHRSFPFIAVELAKRVHADRMARVGRRAA